MEAHSNETPSGKLLDGKYRIDKEIGRGGMATIYAAENVDIGKQVAVKVLAAELATSRTVTERFLREARAAAQVRSPHICEVYDVGTFEQRPFIVMELLQGESLYDRLARERRVSYPIALQIASDVCNGLSKAHGRAIVHRDLKPENIFLSRAEDGSLQTKVVDFGLAKFYDPTNDLKNERLTKAGALFGTPAYMSPEQANAKGSVDHRSDLWALGCIVYEMLTGRTVWEVEQGVAMILAQVATKELPLPSKYAPSLPAAFDAWFKKALARKPEHRFQNAAEFRRTLIASLSNDQALANSVVPDAADGATGNPSTDLSAPDSAPSGHATPTSNQEPVTKQVAATIEPERKAKWWIAAAALVAGLAAAWVFWHNSRSVSVDSTPLAEQIADAQGLIAQGESNDARRRLTRVFKQNRGKAARSLLTHISAVVDGQPGDCVLAGLGHPRPFTSNTESSKATLFSDGESNSIVVWADALRLGGPVQAKTARLDTALRRTIEPVVVTGAGQAVREPTLFPIRDGIGLVYWDMGRDAAGAFTQRLTPLGEIDSKPLLFSTRKSGHPYYPTIAKSNDDGYWVAWVEPTRPRVNDIVVRKLNAKLEPVSEAVAVTAFASTRDKVQADRPSLTIHQDLLHISFVVRRGHAHEVLLLRVPLASALSGPGVTPLVGNAVRGDQELDRFLGQALALSTAGGAHNRASVACVSNGCFVAWDEATVAARVVFVENGGRLRWKKSLGKPSGASARASVASSEDKAVVAWFDAARVYAAPLTPDALGTPSVVGRVSAAMQQPQPTWTRSNKQGEWYLAWRSYEAAQPEPFVARIRCK